MKKKILSGLIVGTFVFGLGAADVQPVSAATFDKVKQTKEKYDKAKEKFGQMRDGDNSNRPEPPKDSDGNPLPPPDKNSNDKIGDLKDKYDKAKDIFKK